MKTGLLFMIFISLTKISFATNDTIIVSKDARLDVLTDKEIQLNKRARLLSANGKYKGFRVLAISTLNREQAFKTKADLLSNFSDEPTYLLFQAPYYKVKIGNFIDRDDADKYRDKLNKFFGRNMYVVEDWVEYSLEDDAIDP
jgi:hypothetical protein